MSTTFLTTKQVAEKFGVNPQTIITWANNGRLPHFRTLGRHRRFRVEDVDTLLAQQEAVTDGAA